MDQIEQRLWRFYEDGRLQAFLERFDEVYPRVGSQNDNAVWLAISRFLRKKDNFWPKAYSPMRELLQQFYSIFWELCAARDEFRDEAAAVVQSLKADGDIELVSWIMREEAARHGIFKADATDHSVLIFKEREEVSVLVSKMADGFRTDHLKTDWLIQRSDPHPLFLALDAGVWDHDCQERLDVVLRNDEAFDIFVLLLFGGNNMIERSSLARLWNLDKYLARLEGRLASSSLEKVHPTVRAALEKAAKRG